MILISTLAISKENDNKSLWTHVVEFKWVRLVKIKFCQVCSKFLERKLKFITSLQIGCLLIEFVKFAKKTCAVCLGVRKMKGKKWDKCLSFKFYIFSERLTSWLKIQVVYNHLWTTYNIRKSPRNWDFMYYDWVRSNKNKFQQFYANYDLGEYPMGMGYLIGYGRHYP